MKNEQKESQLRSVENMDGLASSLFDARNYYQFIFAVPSGDFIYASQSSYEFLNISRESSSSLTSRKIFDPQTCLEIYSLLVDEQPPKTGIVLRGLMLGGQDRKMSAHITLQRAIFDTEKLLVVAVQEILDS